MRYRIHVHALVARVEATLSAGSAAASMHSKNPTYTYAAQRLLRAEAGIVGWEDEQGKRWAISAPTAIIVMEPLDAPAPASAEEGGS